MKKLIILVILITGFINLTFADEPRMRTEFFSNDSTYILKYDLKNNWILKDNNGQIISKIKDENFTSMTIRISNDGNAIVVIDDFAEGHIIKDRIGLWIFHKSELLKKYKFVDLLDDTCNVALSVWHIDWLVNDYNFNQDQNKFEFSTNEFYNYKIDLVTGEIISKNRPLEFDDNTLIVYGSFRQKNCSDIVMNISRYISGNRQPENKIKFRTDSFGDGNWTTAVMIKNGKDITPNEFRYKVMINRCLNE